MDFKGAKGVYSGNEGPVHGTITKIARAKVIQARKERKRKRRSFPLKSKKNNFLFFFFFLSPIRKVPIRLSQSLSRGMMGLHPSMVPSTSFQNVVSFFPPFFLPCFLIFSPLFFSFPSLVKRDSSSSSPQNQEATSGSSQDENNFITSSDEESSQGQKEFHTSKEEVDRLVK